MSYIHEVFEGKDANIARNARYDELKASGVKGLVKHSSSIKASQGAEWKSVYVVAYPEPEKFTSNPIKVITVNGVPIEESKQDWTDRCHCEHIRASHINGGCCNVVDCNCLRFVALPKLVQIETKKEDALAIRKRGSVELATSNNDNNRGSGGNQDHPEETRKEAGSNPG